MEYIQDLVKRNKEFIEKCTDGCEVIKQECDSYFKEIDLFLKTENADFFKLVNTGKENIESAVVTNKRKGRLRKPALADLSENNILRTESVTIKKEKISIIQGEQEVLSLNVQIKKEIEEMPAPTRLPPRKKKIKTEKIDLPKRSTRTRTKKNEANDEITSDNENTRITKGSDVIIQNTTITTIEISDNEKETDSETDKINSQREMRSTRSKVKLQNKHVPSEDLVSSNKDSGVEEIGKNMRSTRTKTKQKKRGRSKSMEHAFSETEKKKSKSDSEKESNQTKYEDAVSVIDNDQDKHLPAADATYIASYKKSSLGGNDNIPPSINSTVVVENPKIVTKETQQSPTSTQTDVKETPKTPPKHVKKNGNKQIFSPFEKTPVKKKVEAFEKLGGVEYSSIPTRVTRTKKKMQKHDDEQKEENELKPSDEKSKHSSEKEKQLTPITYKFVPKVCSTSKISKLHPVYSSNTSTSNESILSVKSASALKASQAEFREREKRRQEKEREALRKKEALLQAQTEEKRRKREEKQQRAQQQREMLEKEMQKQLEAQRIKEEKYKQAMAERDKKLQKQKEEAEKKRQMAKHKAYELLKEKEEAIRIAEQKKYAEMKAVLDNQSELTKGALKQKVEKARQPLPIYMMTNPPLLPTADCYDSDDPEFDPHSRVRPAWSKDREMEEMQRAMIAAGETIKNSFFCRQAQTPDLQEIFEKIDPRKLKRTSSAIWRKPPRYTLMPTLEDTIEFSEDSD
ncbi:inner centromere protein-like [Anoplophora glabripennis]|uniref:inner centromere protein-like n=1 Tax=Anoplophora glabripennis TaxID=217634 RepID=UPI0008757FFB|nr:inner centromere protein-like [Anoplophora glabripennis]